MSTIYIASNNGKLAKRAETLEFYAHDDTKTIIFPYKTEQLIIMGNITITGSAFNVLMKYRIETIFINKNGLFNGKLEFQENKNVLFRKKQFDLLSDSQSLLSFAKQIVLGKAGNQVTFVKRIGRKRGNKQVTETAKVQQVIREIESILKKVPAAESLDSLRGYEGRCARLYFSVFRDNIIQDWAVFNGRSMNPPQDNVNAVLSFLYTLIYYRVDSSLTSVGLDPYVGMFHAINYGKHALAFDLMEEFRVPLGDTVCCSLFNLGILDESDFRDVVFSKKSEDYPLESSDNVDTTISLEKKGVLLTKEGIKKVVLQFERKIESKIYYTPQMKPLSYKKIIIEQMKHYRRVITGEEVLYNPLSTK